MKKIILAICFITAITLSYFYGLLSHRDYLPPYPLLLSVKNHLFPEAIGFKNTAGRIELPCRDVRKGKLMVALAFGQSNSGNHGETLYRPEKPVYNFFEGSCYKAEDPLLGPTGDGGTVWSRLGDLLIQRGIYDRVIFIPIGVGTTTIDQWTRGGYLNKRILKAVNRAKSQGLAITHIFWDQGASEKSTSGDASNKDSYKKNFMEMLASIREKGVTAPVYVPISTYNGIECIKDIQAAQRELVDPGRKIFAGPDTDILHIMKQHQWERVHFSHSGLDACAKMWLAAIIKAEGK